MSGSFGAAWPTLTIAEVTKTSAGGTPKKSGKEFYEGGKIPWLLSGEVASRDIASAKNFITSAGLKGSSAKLFPPGSVLVAMYGATAGEVGILRIEAATNQAVCAILPGEKHIPEYVYYYFLHAKQELVALAVGNAQPNISQAKIRSTHLPVPPLDEQKRIVAVLDQTFAALDRARAHAEANLADAKLLKERGADQLLSRIAVNSPTRHLGELAEFRNGLNFSRHSNGDTVKVAGVGDFQRNFWLPIEDLKTISIEGQLSESDRLCAGDILTVRSNGNKDLIGRVMLLGKTEEELSFSGFVIRIRVQSANVDSEYLCHFMKSRSAVAHLLAGGGGANISNLNQGILSSLPVAVPSAGNQRKFVNSMNNLNAKVELLVEQAEAKIFDLANLRQSLLQKAFSGELT